MSAGPVMPAQVIQRLLHLSQCFPQYTRSLLKCFEGLCFESIAGKTVCTHALYRVEFRRRGSSGISQGEEALRGGGGGGGGGGGE